MNIRVIRPIPAGVHLSPAGAAYETGGVLYYDYATEGDKVPDDAVYAATDEAVPAKLDVDGKVIEEAKAETVLVNALPDTFEAVHTLSGWAVVGKPVAQKLGGGEAIIP